MALSGGHPRGTHSRYVIGCCLIPFGICGLKNNSGRITYGIGCVWGMPFLSPFPLLVYARPFIHCLYFICERKFYACTHVKITRQWKSTLMFWTRRAYAYRDVEFLYLESLCYLEFAISICKSKSKRVHFFFCPKEK